MMVIANFLNILQMLLRNKTAATDACSSKLARPVKLLAAVTR